MGKLNRANKSEFENILRLINDAKNRAFSKVNAELVMLYFNVGNTVSAKVAEGVWGENTVEELAAYIEAKIPGLKAFNRRGLYRMKQFYETYSPKSDCARLWIELQRKKVSAVPTQIKGNRKNEKVLVATQIKKDRNTSNTKVSALPTLFGNAEEIHNQFAFELLAQISWASHLEILSTGKSAEEKMFYLMMAIKEKWSMRELRRQIQTASFERTMLGNKRLSTLPAANHQPLQNIFKDPYIFDFLDLPEKHSENDLEQALTKNLQKFILEIGKGFAYMGAQFRLQVGKKDYHTDLLFYHRDLQCLVLFELKVEEFQPEFLGKLNFYLEVLDRDVKRPNEKPSIGILLCKEKDNEVVKYAMARNVSPTMIAEYETKLINSKLLANKLHELSEQLETKAGPKEIKPKKTIKQGGQRSVKAKPVLKSLNKKVK